MNKFTLISGLVILVIVIIYDFNDGTGLSYPPYPEMTLGDEIIMECKVDRPDGYGVANGVYKYSSKIFGYGKNIERRYQGGWVDWCPDSEIGEPPSAPHELSRVEMEEFVDKTYQRESDQRFKERLVRHLHELQSYNIKKRRIKDNGGECARGSYDAFPYTVAHLSIDFISRKIQVEWPPDFVRKKRDPNKLYIKLKPKYPIVNHLIPCKILKSPSENS
jgi:hypothetical protein